MTAPSQAQHYYLTSSPFNHPTWCCSTQATSGSARRRCYLKHDQQRCVTALRLTTADTQSDHCAQTRITTKYNIPNLDSPKFQQKLKKRKREAEGEEKDGAPAPLVPRATLALKTYDPESGVVLKFKTDRAAEVGRLIAGLGRVGRHMAALPEKEDSVSHPRRLAECC